MPSKKPTPKETHATGQLHFRELTTEECHALLARHQVGRLAFAHKDRVDIEPIHYVADDGWLYGRTSPGTKLEVVTRNRWVAFEVDEVTGPFEMRSVVVKGGLYFLRKEGSAQEAEAYARAVTLLRRLVPETLTPADPMPDRVVLFRIHLDEVTGRAASRG
jgi:nitroimidazol reductase NimA-like FMN-containing flavoprotein (pyridoxamine 5'-phosphate oxidase superfamily)